MFFCKKRRELNRINKKIQMLQKKYNNWERGTDWTTHSIEVNPYYNNLRILKNEYNELLQEYLLFSTIQSV